MKKLLAIVISMAMIVAMMPMGVFAGEAIEIASAEDLAKIGSEAGYPLAGNYELTNDITLSGNWTPIGTEDNPFTGNINGNGHTITGLNINKDSGAYAGLVGLLDGGSVNNIKFDNVSITGTATDVGAAVGRIINGGSVSSIDVISGSIAGSKRVGGVVGSIKASGSISSCSNKATVNASVYNVGGIVGAAYYTEADKEMTISGCENSGNISSLTGVGGIVGLSAAEISSCNNAGKITGIGDGTNESKKSASIGGIVGEQKSFGSVTGNTNTGTIENKDKNGYGTGGIIGWLRYHGSGEASSYARSEIISVTGNRNTQIVWGGNDAGGIVGTVYNSAVITDNTNTAAALSGKTFAAGIVGNYQTTETPAAAKPAENVLIFDRNNSETNLDSINANCKDLLIYTNGNTIKSYVAQISDRYFTTLGDAIAAASDGNTVKLIKDVTEDITVPVGKNIKLNLNNNNLTNNNSDTITVAKGATLTVEGTGTVDNKTHAKAAVFNNGTVTLNGGTYDRTLENGSNNADSGDNSFYTIINHGIMTINAGVTIQTAKKNNVLGRYSSLVENGYQNYTSINERAGYVNETNLEKPTLTINGGSFFGGLNTIKNDDGAELTINNGTFSNFYQAVVQNHNIATINDGEFTAASDSEKTTYAVYNCGCDATNDIGTLTIKGGKFTKANYAFADVSIVNAAVKIENGIFEGTTKAIGVAGESKAEIAVTGGTFSSDPKAYVADGYTATESNGKFVVSRISTGGGGGAAVVPPTTDNVTNNTTDKNTTADLAPAVKDNKAETTVDAKTADKIVDKAVANKSTEVIVDATGNNTVASSEVAIPEKTVKELAEKTDASLVIKTDNGKVDLDKTALEAVAAQAGTTGTVRLVVETVKTDENICHVDLKLITSNGAVKDFRGGNVKVTINLTKELAAKDVVCVYINDNGIYTLVEGVLNADGTYTFTTGHFSEYAVMAKAEADKKIAEQLNTLIKEVNLKVRTSKTAKKNIKAVVSGDVKALTDAGYTVKYKFYRSEKKASKYVSKGEKTADTYINTAGKKGTKYYYKAKAMVYSGDTLVGQTVLKQCKYGVRTWSK